MKQTIEIAVEEYEAMKEEIALLKDQPLIKKLDKLVDLLFEEKYGLYLGDDTSDLVETAIQQNYTEEKSNWDDV
ncbi:MAG: hypothetical protein ABJB05_13630 [Parafilimonas sp.]